MTSADFSPCRTWRYSLARDLDGGTGTVAFVGLNPSTADETLDDPTIRRCLRYARDWGYVRLHVVNLYGFRATRPRDLWRAEDPVGPDNDRVLTAVLEAADLIVAAWGAEARSKRVAEVAELVEGRQLHALGVTKDGAPRHPLYVSADVRPSPYPRPDRRHAGPELRSSAPD